MAIRHKSAAPAGTVAGKVDGNEWNDDHSHIPFEVAMFLAAGNAGVAGVASAAANAEMWSTGKPTRNMIDLSQCTEARLTAVVTALGNATGAAIKLGFMTTNVAAWSNTDLASSGGIMTVGTGTAGTMFNTGWFPVAALARVDSCIVACVVSTAFGTTAPSFGNITAWFR